MEPALVEISAEKRKRNEADCVEYDMDDINSSRRIRRNDNALTALPTGILLSVLENLSPENVARSVVPCSSALRCLAESSHVRETVTDRMRETGLRRTAFYPLILQQICWSPGLEHTPTPVPGHCGRGTDKELRILAAADVLQRRDSTSWLDAYDKARSKMHSPDHFFRTRDADGYARLCFGIKLTSSQAQEALYVGRRWYRDSCFSKWDIRRGSEGKMLPSQPLDEAPYQGEENYTEFHSFEDISRFYWGRDEESDGILECKGPRPADVKCWNGPCLYSGLDHALDDYRLRAGLLDLDSDPDSPPFRTVDCLAKGKLEVHTTGGMNYTGPELVLGMCLNSGICPSNFDVECVTGQHFFPGLDFNDYDGGEWIPPRLGTADIAEVGTSYVASLCGWSSASYQFKAFEEGLTERVLKVLRLTKKYPSAQREDLGFYLLGQDPDT